MQSSAFTSQLQGSQAPWPVITLDEDANQRLPVNPRVGCCATTAPETPLRGVKLTGQGHSIETSWNASRKRSYRRAKRRAERQGGTWYRGKWLSAAALGVPTHACVSNSETPTVRRPPATRTRPRFQAVSYNIGDNAGRIRHPQGVVGQRLYSGPGAATRDPLGIWSRGSGMDADSLVCDHVGRPSQSIRRGGNSPSKKPISCSRAQPLHLDSRQVVTGPLSRRLYHGGCCSWLPVGVAGARQG